MLICLSLEVRIVRMDQTQDQERVNQQIETECRDCERSQMSKFAGWAMQKCHG